ncbi:lysophospholipid acyltransferase family protein [Desulfocicer niacini]
MKQLNRKRDRLLYHAILALLSAIALLPKSWSKSVAGFLGNIWFRMDHRHRHITLENLTHAYGQHLTCQERHDMARKVFNHFIMIIFRIAWGRTIELKHFSRWFTISGMANYHAASRQKKGVLFLTAHLGSWELFPFFYAHTGLVHKGASVFRPLRSPALEHFITNLRQRFGGTMFPLKKALASIIETLENQGTALLLMDQSTKAHKGTVIEFFGRRTYANKGMARLARDTGAPVVPMFLIQNGDGYLIVIEPEIPFVDAGDEETSLQINTQNYNRAIEKMVNQYPDQYFWLHNRWKYQPKQ